mgnify:CR=1 FL=1
MQKERVFKKRYVVLSAMLVSLVILVYQITNFSPLEQSVIKKLKVSNIATLYVTEADAGATTNFTYRYYLFDAHKGDNVFTASDDSQPFLITSDADASVKVENGAIHITLKGKIYKFNNYPAYKINDSVFSVPVYLTSTPF